MTGILGLIGVVWTVSQLYVTLDVAFARIFSAVPGARRRPADRARVRVGRDPGRRRSSGWSSSRRSRPPSTPSSRQRSRSPAAIVGVVASQVFLLVGTIVLVAHPLPGHAAARAEPCGRSLPPAIVAGLAIWFLTQAFTFLVPRLVGVAALAGSLATAFIALAWLSFLFQALLYGAAWVKVREDERLAGGSAPGRSRSAGRTGRWRRVTARS